MARNNIVTRIKSTTTAKVKRPKFVKSDEFAALQSVVIDNLQCDSDQNALVVFDPEDVADWNSAASDSVYKMPAVSSLLQILTAELGRGVVPIMEGESEVKIAATKTEESDAATSDELFSEIVSDTDEPAGVLEWSSLREGNLEDHRIVGFATKNYKAKKEN